MAKVKLGKFEFDSIGTFKLEVNRDPKKFRMTNISAFIPFGKTDKDVVAFMDETGLISSLFISKISTILEPDKSDIDKHNVDTLIRHPNVRISGMTDEEHRELVKMNLKVSNPLFTITNIDKKKEESFENEQELLKVRYMIYNEDLTNQKLIWLCSKFKLSYSDSIVSGKVYRNRLVEKLDKFVRASVSNRNKFLEAVEDIVNTEYTFFINELKNLGIITDIGGIYKIGERPVGSNDDSIIKYYKENNELFEQHKKEVINSLDKPIKNEIN